MQDGVSAVRFDPALWTVSIGGRQAWR
jgi:hypothetical protein